MGERCDWNPQKRDAATEPAAPGDCPNEATVIVGANGYWQLCESCAALPDFSRFKFRVRMAAASDRDRSEGGDRNGAA